MQIPPPEKSSAWRIAGMASFAIGVALFLLVSSRAGMRWMGVVTLVGAVVQIVQRRIAYGWEGREPSGYITGIPAVVLGVLLGALGVAMLVQTDLMLAVFGWDKQ
jgi:uncharacterized membrane protein YfcA